jgi:hypothetical protein
MNEKQKIIVGGILSVLKDSHTILTIAVTAVCTSLIYILSPNLKELLKLFLQWCKSIFFSS